MLRLALQPAASAVSLGRQVLLASHERLAQAEAEPVQEISIQPDTTLGKRLVILIRTCKADRRPIR